MLLQPNGCIQVDSKEFHLKLLKGRILVSPIETVSSTEAASSIHRSILAFSGRSWDNNSSRR
jgi:hypothetical protein